MGCRRCAHDAATSSGSGGRPSIAQHRADLGTVEGTELEPLDTRIAIEPASIRPTIQTGGPSMRW
jgi:hypothetical protein